ncbi:hypothetical protein [Phocaeicola plebeius]|uniref:hypothetical protein n=1 Tax=Phocaeicola plebeius TaxID=310297 RepID=UPI00307C8C65
MALNKQIWVSQLKENFYPERNFLTKVTDFTSDVDANTLHIASSGIDPKVLINNNTYPINIVEREDQDNQIPLDVFDTENTVVRHVEEAEYNYGKLESVIRQHRSTLQTSTAQKAIHAFAPLNDSDDTPLVEASGEVINGRKRIRFADILNLKEKFDNALVPLEERYLVLHPTHVTDLMLEDLQLFKDLTEIREGEPIKFAGFGTFQFPYMPKYTRTEPDAPLTKADFSIESKNGSIVSVAFQKSEVMKADGTIDMFARVDDPEERGTIVGFQKRFIAMPIRNKGIGAIISVDESTNASASPKTRTVSESPTQATDTYQSRNISENELEE